MPSADERPPSSSSPTSTTNSNSMTTGSSQLSFTVNFGEENGAHDSVYPPPHHQMSSGSLVDRSSERKTNDSASDALGVSDLSNIAPSTRSASPMPLASSTSSSHHGHIHHQARYPAQHQHHHHHLATAPIVDTSVNPATVAAGTAVTGRRLLHDPPTLPVAPIASNGYLSAFYFPQFPNISNYAQYMPGLPSVQLPSISGSLPSIPVPSLPNISLPQLPTLPQLPPLPGLPQFPTLPSIPSLLPTGFTLGGHNWNTQKKTWTEFRESVRMVHRRLSELSSKIPFGFTFRELNGKSGNSGNNFFNARNSSPHSKGGGESNWVRIYFLSSLSQTSETSLFYCDVDLNHDYLSKEYLAQVERQRERFRESGPSSSSHQSPLRNSPSSHRNSPSSHASDLSSRSPIASASDNFSIHRSYLHDSSSNDLVPNSSTTQPANVKSPRPNYTPPIASSFLGNFDPNTFNTTSETQAGISVSSPGPSSTSQSEGSFEWVPLIESSKYTRMCITRSSTSGSSSGSSSTSRPTETEQNVLKSPTSNKDPNSSRRKPQHHEEKLQMERKRIMITGITSYEYDPHSNRFVFGSGGKLFFFDDHEYETRMLPNSNNSNFSYPPYIPRKVHSDILMSKVNPQICPSNPDLLAYLCDGDIWVTHLKSGHELRLTTTKLISEEQDRCVSAGLPSYVIQEEFRRYCGFWWQPESDYHHIDEDGEWSEYTILYEEVDETDVDIIKINSNDGNVEDFRFPRAGCANAISNLRMVSFRVNNRTNDISDETQTSDLPCALEALYPHYEYLVRCGFHSRDVIWIQLLNRRQNNLVLALISLTESFPPQVIYEENIEDYWVNVADVLHFLNAGDPLTRESFVEFIWTSEETGFRHLYKIKVQLKSLPSSRSWHAASGTPQGDSLENVHMSINGADGMSGGGAATNSANSDIECDDQDISDYHGTADAEMQSQCEEACTILRAELHEKIQLTSGQWEVSDKDVWVDEANELIYFVGTKDTPTERHLYVVTYRDAHKWAICSGLAFEKNQETRARNSPRSPFHSTSTSKYGPKRLTDESFSHSLIAMGPKFNFFVNVQSNISIPPFGFVNRIKFHSDRKAHPLPMVHKVGFIITNSLKPTVDPENGQVLTEFDEQIDSMPGLSKPEMFTYRISSGDLIYGLIFKPENMEDGVKYPVVLDIYGGPEVQLVCNSFKHARHVRRHLLSTEGYVVVALDCRGSRHRGTKFEAHIQYRMGQVEIADQVEVLKWLGETTPYIDMDRIAVHGWSYGGYLSLMALAQRPDIFKVAIAGAPVTNWALYDTGYTERYMDTPANNPDGYAKGSVLNYVNQFPNEENRLLIIHGLMDENVHFQHTVELINALIKAGKPYSLQVYPSERHSVRNSHCCEHFATCLLSFLQNNLH